jgi:hypothetical protein
MTLLLERGTQPEGLGVKTLGGPLGNIVFLGNYQISLEDFLFAAEYVLTNTNLKSNDPRLQFVKCVKSMKKVEGFGSGGKRLEVREPMRFSRIKIIAVPPGQAPEEVRKEWVGAEIPLLAEQETQGFEIGVLGGEPDPQNIGGFRVDPDEAICALIAKNTTESSNAAKWWIYWRENTRGGRTCDALVFAKEVCKIVSY